jgi:hypothetical protein
LGLDTIQVEYSGNQDFAASTTSIVELVRAHRSKRKAASSHKHLRFPHAVSSTVMVSRVGETTARLTDAVRSPTRPTALE